MIDSVLKGSGNSRFLKSAVPAGTSWADALAMLQAGTFPIDFNGINTEGFQQVGTPLNKANLLKDATAAQIGLPPSTTPDGMFQALGNTGELHVWRKTVTTAQEIPAGYTLESAKETLISTRAEYGSGTQHIIVEYASSCSVSESGDPYLVNSSSVILEAASSNAITSLNNLKGKFLKFSKDSSYQYVTVTDGIFFIPSDATFRLESGPYRIFADKAQKVNGYAKVPAGTTTTYPVSTNPNAYQEGDDAKAAGYVGGEVKTDKKVVSALSNGGNTVYWTFSNTLTVADDGTISLANGTTLSLRALDSDAVSNAQPLIGKYACFSSMGTETTGTDFPLNQVIFFPSDTTFTMVSKVENGTNKNTIQASKYQPVTGYPAIPAGTTIEYLGKLGDKARAQVVSYVGTGAYGSGNETKIPVDFLPELLIIAIKDITRRTVYISVPRSGTGLYLSADGSTSIYGEMSTTVSYVDGKVRILCFDAFGQMNASGYTYIAVALR